VVCACALAKVKIANTTMAKTGPKLCFIVESKNN
jgi:hypothetical protein